MLKNGLSTRFPGLISFYYVIQGAEFVDSYVQEALSPRLPWGDGNDWVRIHLYSEVKPKTDPKQASRARLVLILGDFNPNPNPGFFTGFGMTFAVHQDPVQWIVRAR